MRMRPEDVEKAMSRTVPSDVRCLHATSIVPIPTPDGFMFAFRVVSHGDPGDQAKADGFVPESEINVTDYGMNEHDLYELAAAVCAMLDLQAEVTPGLN